MSFKKFLQPDNEIVSEKFKKSMGYRDVEDLIGKLEKSLSVKGVLCRKLTEELGPSIKKDFDNMNESLMNIVTIWEDIDMQLSMNESNNDDKI